MGGSKGLEAGVLLTVVQVKDSHRVMEGQGRVVPISKEATRARGGGGWRGGGGGQGKWQERRRRRRHVGLGDLCQAREEAALHGGSREGFDQLGSECAECFGPDDTSEPCSAAGMDVASQLHHKGLEQELRVALGEEFPHHAILVSQLRTSSTSRTDVRAICPE